MDVEGSERSILDSLTANDVDKVRVIMCEYSSGKEIKKYGQAALARFIGRVQHLVAIGFVSVDIPRLVPSGSQVGCHGVPG